MKLIVVVFAALAVAAAAEFVAYGTQPIQGAICGFYANGTSQVIIGNLLTPMHIAGSGNSVLFWTEQRLVYWWDQSYTQPRVVFTSNADITDIASFGDKTLFVVSGSALTVVDVTSTLYPQVVYNNSGALSANARGTAMSATEFAFVDYAIGSKLFIFNYKTGTTATYTSPCYSNFLLTTNNKQALCGILCTSSYGYYPLVGVASMMPSTYVSWGYINPRSTAVAIARDTAYVASSDGIRYVGQQGASYKIWNPIMFFDLLLVE